MTLKDIEIWRKRLIYRAWHRGTREMDLLLGRFADAHVPGFDGEELAQFERILGYNDPDLYDWVTGKEPPPSNYINKTLSLLLNYRFTTFTA